MQSYVAPEEARAIASEAYIYGFPIVDSYRIQHSYFAQNGGTTFKAPWNQIYHEGQLCTPENADVPAPNLDIVYSLLGADLRAEPLVLTVPAVNDGRYYALQFVDLYTFNFAYVGSRTTGHGAGSFVLAGPRWTGKVPDGIKSVVQSETEFAFVLYQTQLLSPDDLENVAKVQRGYGVQPLSRFLRVPPPPAAPRIDFVKPLPAAEERASLKFFELLNFVLQFCPTHPTERALMARFAQLGVGAKETFTPDTLLPEMRVAIEDGIAEAWKQCTALEQKISWGIRGRSDMFGTRNFLRDNYLYRMAGCVGGIYGPSKEEALCPDYLIDSGGEKLDGSRHCYTLRFAPGHLPPVNGFWSLTMYELPARCLFSNSLKRYVISSPMLAGLKRDADSGVTLYIQRDSPGEGKEPNWLPAPDGEFLLTLRLYWPKPEALRGKWKQPPLERQPAADVILESAGVVG